MGGLAFYVHLCGCEHMCRERKRGLAGSLPVDLPQPDLPLQSLEWVQLGLGSVQR